MEANFNNFDADSETDLGDVVLGVVLIAGIAGLGYLGYKKLNEESAPKTTPQKTSTNPPPQSKKMQVSTGVALSKAPKDTVLWLQKYLNRQVIAPKVGDKLNEEISIKFIEENGVWSIKDNSPFLIGLWLFFQKHDKEGLDLSYELGEAVTLKFLFDYVGLDIIAAIQDPQSIQGELSVAAKPKTEAPVYSLPDVEAKLKDVKTNTVFWIQKFLNLMTAADGSPLVVDGKMGRATKEKLAAYLSANHRIFAVDYSPKSTANNNFMNFSLRELMGSTGAAKQYFSVAM